MKHLWTAIWFVYEINVEFVYHKFIFHRIVIPTLLRKKNVEDHEFKLLQLFFSKIFRIETAHHQKNAYILNDKQYYINSKNFMKNMGSCLLLLWKMNIFVQISQSFKTFNPFFILYLWKNSLLFDEIMLVQRKRLIFSMMFVLQLSFLIEMSSWMYCEGVFSSKI